MLMSPLILPVFITFAATSPGEEAPLNVTTPTISLNIALADLILHLGYAALAIALVMRFHKIKLNDVIGLRNGNLARIIPLSIVTGILVVPLAFGISMLVQIAMKALEITPDPQQLVQEIKNVSEKSNNSALAGFIILATLRAPIVEEILFRGLLFPSIKSAGHPFLAYGITAVLFGAIHGTMLHFFSLTILALMLSWQYDKTGNLLSPIITHVVFNTVNLLIMLEIIPLHRLFPLMQ